MRRQFRSDLCLYERDLNDLVWLSLGISHNLWHLSTNSQAHTVNQPSLSFDNILFHTSYRNMVTEASESRVSNQSEGQSSVIATEPDHEKQAVDVPDFGPAPDGGVRAWLVAAGAGCIFFCCLGFSHSFGTFTEYYVDHQLRGESTDAIAWIGSLSAFLQFFAGMLGGPLFDRFGAKVCHLVLLTYEPVC